MANVHNDKNEPSRFLGEGVSFKAKLIGILEVSEARGDRMCQEALADLKMAIRAAGEHKQRITIHVAIDGLRLRDEKTGDSLYHHPVHKISFIAQDMSDSRAFGYIFGSPDTGHRFFGIKTDKAASQVVIAMRDLFQVVFELKKKEIELAKQHLELKPFVTTSKMCYVGQTHLSAKMSVINESGGFSKSPSGADAGKGAAGGPAPEAIADLVDLELELSSIQQGIHQMERITPSDPFGPNKDDHFPSDPFGDSFTSFPQKPFLPPPPSAKDRSTRTASESGSLFSPRAGLLSVSSESASRHEGSMFDSPSEEPTEWFPANSSFSNDDSGPASAVSITKDGLIDQTKHEETKNSILAQFDVFTELDPLGTGRSKPYVDKKLFFQELKNPPKKVLKDLVGTTSVLPTSAINNVSSSGESNLFKTNFEAKTETSFQVDPFADEDPFDKSDPFAEEEFKPQPQDPFNTDFVVDFKMYKQELKPIQNAPTLKTNDCSNELIDSLKFPPVESILASSFDDNLKPLFPSTLSKSPNKSSALEKQVSMSTASPHSLFSKQSTFECKFDFHDKRKDLTLLHENPSLDMSSESESTAPEPPPRPPTIKPPPLPPKKQQGDMTIKPPPRPPHTDIDAHYDYIESGPNSLDSIDKSPPLPVPARRPQFREQWDSGGVPQRPRKTLSNAQSSSQEEYLTPVPPPLLPPQKKDSMRKAAHKGPILLPPPQKKDTLKKKTQKAAMSTSLFETAPEPPQQPDISDITLTDLTTSGLDKLANKLNVPASKLSNMTLVELTSYLQEHIQTNRNKRADANGTTNDVSFPTFKAEFSMNFTDFNDNSKLQNETSYDRYAVFRELLEKEESEESKQPNITDVTEEVTNDMQSVSISDEIPVKDTNKSADRYAALRDIIVEDLVPTEEKELNITGVCQDPNDEIENELTEFTNEQNDLNQDSNKQDTTKDDQELDLFHCIDSALVFNSEKIIESKIIEYTKPIELEMNDIPTKDVEKNTTPTSKSPVPLNKSPVPIAITEIITQSNNHLTSGSLSDVISGSSPEVDNGGSPDIKKKDTTAESWAIFDTPKMQEPSSKEKNMQSEEGVSPWSSDSKEFTNVSPTDWRQRKDSGGSGSEKQRSKHRGKDHHDPPGWWDAGPKMRDIREKYGGHQPSRDDRERHRRSTDSYDEEYDMERSYHTGRERRMRQSSWSRGHQSSSSRDVSPWEEEPCRDWSRRRGPPPTRRSRDSWDEEDDYEYDVEHPENTRWSSRRSASRERHGARRAVAGEEVWTTEDRRHGSRRRYRPPAETDHHCCGEWEQDSDTGCLNEQTRYPNRYGQDMWRDRDRKREEERYYSRNRAQESPWEDEYSNDPEEPHAGRYLTAKRGWKRPSSASEMDRRSGENKSRQNPYHMVMTGSDGERERRYKTTGRRARSRDSENTYNRHKPDPSLTLRHRSNREKHPKSPFEDDFSEQSLDTPSPKTKYDFNVSKTTKKTLASPKSDIESPQSNASSKLRQYTQNMEIVSPIAVKADSKFKFDNDFSEVASSRPFEADSYQAEKDFSQTNKKSLFQTDFFDKDFRKPASREEPFFETEFVPAEKEQRASPKLKKSFRQDSQFEDDFSPTEKSMTGGDSISSIAEEIVEQAEISFPKNNHDRSVNFSDTKRQKSSLGKRLSANLRADLNLKKSESVNIFARENDPFDDDFFSKPENGAVVSREHKSVGSESVQWTEDFDCFDVIEENQ